MSAPTALARALDGAALLEASHTVGQEIAAPNAASVDAEARFPIEAISACREAGILAALLPAEHGGAGLSLQETGESVAVMASYCASTGMILAMHHLQVASLARHGGTEELNALARDVAAEGLLLASATTEAGIGGQLRTSSCALEGAGGRFRLAKQAPVISYGAAADAILVTARRTANSAPNDQVLVACLAADLRLEQTSEWNAFGMRGTCSSGYLLSAEGVEGLVFPSPFEEIAEQTMLPVSHVLWAFVWLGLAGAAVDRARRYVQASARKSPGERPPSALRLAELSAKHLTLAQLVRSTAAECDATLATTPEEGRFQMADLVALNSLKVSASELVVEVVTDALRICGMAGYSLSSPFSMGQLLRDAHSGALMIGNDRLLRDNADMLLMTREAQPWTR